jgi:hypothetical protein
MPPKKKQNSNQGEVAEDFDDMLADFRAADLANAPLIYVTQSVAGATRANAASAATPEVTVPEATILTAMRAGDLCRLRRWHRQGIRYSANMVCMAAGWGSMAVMRCLVEE